MTSIHNAQPAMAQSNTPASRVPQSARAALRRIRNCPQIQGPASSQMPLPIPNSAMAHAPCHTPPLKAATSKAEYNKLQGISAHKTPTSPKPEGAAVHDCMRRHTARPALSTQAGWRACSTIANPHARTATCIKVHTGRKAAVCCVIQAKPSMANAAKAPANA